MLPIALALAQFAPMLAGLFGGDKAEAVAGKVVEIAQAVTGQPTPDAALKAIQADPNLAMQFQKAVLDNKLELEKLAVANAADVNKTMQAEAGAEHWPTYIWRPMIGMAVALNVASCSITVMVAYISVMFANGKPEMLAYIPGMLGAMAAVVGVVMPVLGIASWFRGRMQADPNIPTINRG